MKTRKTTYQTAQNFIDTVNNEAREIELLEQLISEKKIPLEKRKILPILVSNNEILWIPGIRRSNIGPITNTTKNIIKIEVKMEDVYEAIYDYL